VSSQEVHGTLAPAGSLHQEHPFAAVHQRVDRLALIAMELGIGPPRKRAERIEQFIGHERDSTARV
jgi:hypothetical protein